MSLRSTAANLSRIGKSRGPKKLFASPLKRKKETSRKQFTIESSGCSQNIPERLEVLEHNIQIDFQIARSSSMLEVINNALSNQWAESTTFHDIYFSREAKQTAKNTSDLLFLLRGLSMETKADIIKYRTQQLPKGGLLTINQLYTIFDSKGNTYVDRSLELCTRDGLLRKFVIANALPVILRTGKGGMYNHVSYGYENAEFVVKLEQYLNAVTETTTGPEPLPEALADKFKELVRERPNLVFVTEEDFSVQELAILVERGLLTLSSNHNYEIDINHYVISYPKCGTFLKMINSGRSWLVKTLSKAAFKEALETDLFDKWQGRNMCNFRKPFYGYDLFWILAEAKGSGIVEAFLTPMGRGWRLTGKL